METPDVGASGVGQSQGKGNRRGQCRPRQGTGQVKHISERKRAKFTGRGKCQPFFQLPHYVISSPQWAALSGRAIKLLVDLGSDYNGRNNGDLSAAWTLMKRRGWRSKDTLANALAELLAARFVTVTRHGGRHCCTLLAITWLPIHEAKGKVLEVAPNAVPSNAWRQIEVPAPESVPACPENRGTEHAKAA